MTATPPVTVVIPVYNEERHIGQTLDAVGAQTYPAIVEVLVVDGGSTDRTRALVEARGGKVKLLDNPRRIQAAALNIAVAAASGAVVVRVDGHCRIDPDYVERCVKVLADTGAAMVGGAMRPVAEGWFPRGVAAAMTSPLGAGPARFHVGGAPGWVDTVYLGAYRTAAARAAGGYREDVGVNEDAEFAIRMAAQGGVWFDDRIRSTYTPRSSVRALIRQFYRYGRSRSATVRLHPETLAPRQLASPLLTLALLSPWRNRFLAAYLGVVLAGGVHHLATSKDARSAAGFVVALPAMHLPWGFGFLRGLLRRRPATIPPAAPAPGQHDAQAA